VEKSGPKSLTSSVISQKLPKGNNNRPKDKNWPNPVTLIVGLLVWEGSNENQWLVNCPDAVIILKPESG
jgi:hypothetical protein